MADPPIREEEPLDDGGAVVRGGLHSLDAEKVWDLCEDSLAIVLPDVSPGTIEELIACLTSMPNPAKQR